MKVIKRTAEQPVSAAPRHSARRALLIGLLTAATAGAGCKAHKAAPAAPPPAATDSTVPDSAAPVPVAAAPAPVVSTPAIEVRPACDQLQITENGAAALQIGDPRDSVGMRCPVVSDSSTVDGMGKAQGDVVVSAGGSTMVAQLVDGRVSRLTIADPQFRTADGLGVGVPVTQLMAMPGAIVLEGVHDLSIVVNAHCGLYFRIPKPVVPQSVDRWADVVAGLPPGTSIEHVVVHGCRSAAAS